MIDIKLEYYKVFHAVATEGSFSLAGKKLFMSQSAVSQSIKYLEKSMGVILFNRTSKGAELSQQGKILMDYVSSAIQLISAGEERILLSKTLEYGNLKICASDTICSHILLPYLEYFSKSYPSIKLHIFNRTSLEGIELLKNGHIDLAFINLPITDNRLNIVKTFNVQDIFVASERFKHLKNTSLSAAQLSNLPLIFLEKKANSRTYVEDFFTKQGIILQPEIELCSHELLLKCASINLGISCVVDIFSKEYLQNQLFKIDVKPPIPPRSIAVCSLQSVSISPSAQRLIDIILTQSLPNNHSFNN